MPSEKSLCSCIIEKVDKDETAVYTYKLPDNNGNLETVIEDAKLHTRTRHLDAIKKVVELITSNKIGVIGYLLEIIGIGHRAV